MLNKSSLGKVLEDWSYWNKPLPASIPREALGKIFGLDPDLVLVIQGVRRCGKSTLLAQIMTRLNLDSRDCFFVNFEDPRLSDHLNFHLLEQILAFAEERRPQSAARYFFLDEIQNVAQWQKWLHAKVERPSENRFVITGSNAALLSGDLATRLTGRHRTIELFPFDFLEFQQALPDGSIEDYLNCGGFPRAVVDAEPFGLLREYLTDIVERDVRRQVSVRSSLPLVQLVKAVFESTGSETSQRSLAGLLGVSADTAGSYLDACEAAYLLLPCRYFTFSERQRSARNRKYYPVDLGLRNSVITKTGADRGKGLETAVFLHLRKKHRQVFYWRQQGEVDFVTMDESGITPYQVSWEGPKPRHEIALNEFYQAYPKAKPCVQITKENLREYLAEA